jgi:hypothetical protein
MPVDWSALTDWRQSLNWANKVESDKDVYQKSDKFIAKVLTVPVKSTAKELAGALGIVIPEESSQKIVKFKGRIQGAHSPHSFLPDPCKINVTKNPDKAKRVVALHTTFYYASDGEDPLEPDDDVRVFLGPGHDMNAPFNLQIGHAVKKINKPEGAVAWLKGILGGEGECADLAGLPWDGSKPLGSSGGAASQGAYTEPRDFTAEGAEQALTTEADESICEGYPEEFIMMHPLNADEQYLQTGAENFGQVDFLHPNPHGGVDMGLSTGKGFGSTLYAVADGTIISAMGGIKDDPKWGFTFAGGGEKPWGWIRDVAYNEETGEETGYTSIGTGGLYTDDGDPGAPGARANGNHVSMIFDHPDAAELGLLAFYLHMADTPLVAPGTHVVQGQPIGFMGNTGYSMGFHLHWQINQGYFALYDGSKASSGTGPINPMQWIKTSGPCKEFPLPPVATEEETEEAGTADSEEAAT